jgi:hypothetical protein
MVMFCTNHTVIGAVVMYNGDTCPICNLITENHQHAERLSVRTIGNFLEQNAAAVNLDITTPEELELALKELDQYKDANDGDTPEELGNKLENLGSWEELGDFDEVKKILDKYEDAQNAVSEAFNILKNVVEDF